MTTVTLDKEAYDNLIKYKEAYEKNQVVLEVNGNVDIANNIGYEYTRLSFIEINEAVKLMDEKIKEFKKKV